MFYAIFQESYYGRRLQKNCISILSGVRNILALPPVLPFWQVFSEDSTPEFTCPSAGLAILASIIRESGFGIYLPFLRFCRLGKYFPRILLRNLLALPAVLPFRQVLAEDSAPGFTCLSAGFAVLASIIRESGFGIYLPFLRFCRLGKYFPKVRFPEDDRHLCLIVYSKL